MKKSGRTDSSASYGRRSRSVLMAVLLVLVVLLSLGSGLYAGASFFPQQAPNVTITTTIFTTTTSWTTSTIWSVVTSVVYGVWTTVQYTTSTSTVTATGNIGPDTSTMLLLHMDGTDGSQTFVDSSLQAHSVTAQRSARISTAQSKFGGASGLFGGAGDYLSLADSSDWAFGSGDFTIDFWIRFNALPARGLVVGLYDQRDASQANYATFLLWNDAGTYKYVWGVNTATVRVIQSIQATTLSTNTWYHVALVRSGNNWYIFQNGTQVGSTVSDADAVPDIKGTLLIGAYFGPAGYLNGWFDEFRVSKGVARWTSNFIPPTAPY